jgi:hypothetical protein
MSFFVKISAIPSTLAVTAALAFGVPASAAPSVNTGPTGVPAASLDVQLVHSGNPGWHCHPAKYSTVRGKRGHVRRILVTPSRCHAGRVIAPYRYGGPHRYRAIS